VSRIRIAVEIDPTDLPPRELRKALISALRESIMVAHAEDEIDLPTAEELFRALPYPGQA
jgi:hypothetical protein